MIQNTPTNSLTKKVGVFVNETKENIHRIYRECSLDIVQLHGDESAEFCNNLELPYWKVIRVKNRFSLREMIDFRTDTFLLDAYDFSQDVSNIQYGGLGKEFES